MSTETATTIIVWGEGPAQSVLVREGEHTERAGRLALDHGFDVGANADRWAVEVTAEPDDVDAATRFDAGIVGWAEVT